MCQPPLVHETTVWVLTLLNKAVKLFIFVHWQIYFTAIQVEPKRKQKHPYDNIFWTSTHKYICHTNTHDSSPKYQFIESACYTHTQHMYKGKQKKSSSDGAFGVSKSSLAPSFHSPCHIDIHIYIFSLKYRLQCFVVDWCVVCWAPALHLFSLFLLFLSLHFSFALLLSLSLHIVQSS